MQILLDADSCPKQVRELILRSSQRLKVPVVFAANRPIPGRGAAMEVCPAGEGSADDRIVQLAVPGDLAITRDLPLAERLVEKQINVMDDRGRIYTKDNIKYYRSLRDFSVSLAHNNMGIERIANYDKKDLKKFADSLDRILNKIAANSNK
jgi:uncharacterized protein YaiI (UPF0178 family)